MCEKPLAITNPGPSRTDSISICAKAKNGAGVSWPSMTALGIGNCGKAEDGGFLSSSHCNLISFEIITGRDLKLENPEQTPGEQRKKMVLKVLVRLLCVGQLWEDHWNMAHVGMREDSTHEEDVLEVRGLRAPCISTDVQT